MRIAGTGDRFLQETFPIDTAIERRKLAETPNFPLKAIARERFGFTNPLRYVR